MNAIPNSVLDFVDAEIDRFLFRKDQLLKGFRYDHKRSCIELSKVPPSPFDGCGLVAAIYDRIQKNLLLRPNREPSSENWKFRLENNQKTKSEAISNKQNKSDEVTLEREIANKWPTEWKYQIPIASGLFGSTSDKRRAIDLVYVKEKNAGCFDFVELKIASNTPLFAAMEILCYGLVYYASRVDTAKNLRYERHDQPLLKSNEINLCVLAPTAFYHPDPSKELYNLQWLQQGINDGLRGLVQIESLCMNFRFESFSPGFEWSHEMTSSQLPDILVRDLVYP